MIHRVPRPEWRTFAFGLAALVALAGVGLGLWGMPPTSALGRPKVSREAPVTPTDVAAQRMSGSPAVAADPTEDRFVALAHGVDGPERGCGLQVSGDSGASWVAAAMPQLPEGVEWCSSLDVAFDGGGRLYLLFTGFAGPDPSPTGVYLSASDDRARTFATSHRVLGPSSRGARLAVDPSPGGAGTVHLAWLADSGVVMAAQSGDGGRSVSEPVEASDPGERVGPPALTAQAGGGVKVAYFDLGSEDAGPQARPRSLVVAVTDRTGSFGSREVVDTAVVAPPQDRAVSGDLAAPPAMAASADRTCLAWTDSRFGDPDVLLRCRSLSGGWEPARRVNDDRRGSGYWQYRPGLAIADTGRIDVAFFDRRENVRNSLTGVSYSYSYDALRFSPNVFLNRQPFDATLRGGRPSTQAETPGDTGPGLAVAAGDTASLAAWTDTRNHTPELVAQDVYSAQATLLFASRRPPWAAPAGAATVALGAAGLWLFRRRAPVEP